MNYKLKNTLFTIFLITGSISISSAQLALVNEPDKPSVQAAEMTRYGKYNAQLYTGRLSLNIPVYVYRDADFTIPVSLSYSYNGLVVNRQPGVAAFTIMLLELGFNQKKIVLYFKRIDYVYSF